MRVEIVQDKVPSDDQGHAFHRLANVPGEISSSVRVLPADTFPICPVQTLKFMVNDTVPYRMYSNSRRSTLPGAIGKPGCFRSNA